MPDQLPAVDMSTFKPLGSTEPTAPQAGNNLPPVDMSTFKSLTGEPAASAAKPPQPGIGEQVAQGFGSAAATGLAGVAKIASHIPGLPTLANKVGDVMGLPKLNPAGPNANPYDTVQKSAEQNAQQAQSTWAGKGGALLETAAEFAVGEEALKGLTQVERLQKLMPMMKMFENSPKLLKAAQVAMTSAKAGVVMGGQEAAHGGTAGQVATQAAVGAGLGVAGSALWGAGKMGYNALKAAGWSGAALDAVTKIASENVKPAEEVGDLLTQKITNHEAVAHTNFDNMLESIRGKVGDTPVPLSGSPLHEAAVSLQADMAKLPEGIQSGIKGLVPSEGNMNGLLEGLTDGSTKDMTGSQLIDLRQQLSKQLPRVAPALKEGIGKVLDGIDDTLDKVAGEAGHVEGVSDEYSAARSAYRQSVADLKEPFVQRIQSGKISDALDMLGKGQEAPHRMDVLKRLVGEDTVTGLGLNKFADVIKSATDEDGNLVLNKAISGWDKLSDETKKSMFSASPEVGQQLEQLMDGLRTMRKVRTTVKAGAALASLGMVATGMHKGMGSTLSAIETVGGVAALIYGGTHGGQEIIEKLATNKTLLEGLGKLYGYAGENAAQRLGTAGRTAEQLMRQGAEGPVAQTSWEGVMNAARNLSTGSEEGAAGNVRKRNVGDPIEKPSLIGKRGIKAVANQADDVAAVNKKATPGHTYGYEKNDGTHQVTARNPEGKSVALVTATEDETDPTLRTVRFSSGGQGEGLKAYGRMAEATKAEANRTGQTITLQGDEPDDMSAAARRTWVKLGEQHGYDVQWSADHRPHVTFRPEPEGGLDAHEAAAAAHNANGGSTFHPEQGDMNGKPAFAVAGSYPNLSDSTDGEKITPEQYKAYSSRPDVQKALSENPKAAIGTWGHEGKTDWEVSSVHDNKDEAIALGKKNNQIAIHDLSNHEDIPTGGKGTRPLQLTHYSNVEGLTETDPAQHGTGVRGAERDRMKEPGYLPRTYFGTEGYKEPAVQGRRYAYKAQIDPSKIYDVAKDPDGIWAKAGGGTAGENAVHDAGYAGYSRDGVVAAFDKMPVTSTPTPASASDLASKEIGTRHPSAAGALGVNNPAELSGMDALNEADKQAPARMTQAGKPVLGIKQKLVAALQDYKDNGISHLLDASNPDAALNQYIEHMKDNLKWLHDQMPKSIRDQAKHWYETAHNTTKKIAADNGITHEQEAGVTAALSPKNDWNNNVGQAKRLIEHWKNDQNHAFTPQMDEALSAIRNSEAINPALRKVLTDIRGKSYGELTGKTPEALLAKQAMWFRILDEAHGSPDTPIYGPDGSITGSQTLNWGQVDPLAKALKILEDGSVQNINDVMGQGHKIRNFYNNIINPFSERGHVTVDTHQVGASLLKPFSQNDLEVAHNFGSGNKQFTPSPAKHAATGLQGSYPVYEEAVRRAAAELGLQPRELQSITWEGIRSLMGDIKKTPELRRAVSEIWRQHEEGTLSVDQARQEILKASGGFAQPNWMSDAQWEANPNEEGDTSFDVK
jgi:hypothetical protein